ncbi:MAG: hypothetical protein RIM84_15495 [Alphaproteobacteria bacterium]
MTASNDRFSLLNLGAPYVLGKKIVALFSAVAYLSSVPALAAGIFLLCSGGGSHDSFGQLSVATSVSSTVGLLVNASGNGDETTTLVGEGPAINAVGLCQDVEVQHFQGPAPRKSVDAPPPVAPPVPLRSGVTQLAAVCKAAPRPYASQEIPDIALKARRAVVLLI